MFVCLVNPWNQLSQYKPWRLWPRLRITRPPKDSEKLHGRRALLVLGIPSLRPFTGSRAKLGCDTGGRIWSNIGVIYFPINWQAKRVPESSKSHGSKVERILRDLIFLLVKKGGMSWNSLREFGEVSNLFLGWTLPLPPKNSEKRPAKQCMLQWKMLDEFMEATEHFYAGRKVLGLCWKIL